MSNGGKLVAFLRPESEQNPRLFCGGTAKGRKRHHVALQRDLARLRNLLNDIGKTKVKEISFDPTGNILIVGFEMKKFLLRRSFDRRATKTE